jgi:cell division protein FtsI/penicillin-binding protein 2
LAIRVAGKTGTADHGRHGLGPHAWFAGYAPAAEDPTDADCAQIAFAVLIEYGGHGGAEAAPIVYAFLKEIYGTRARPNPNPGGPAAVLPNAHPSERSTMP